MNNRLTGVCVLVAGLTVVGGGCNSVYHKARLDMPPAAQDRVRLRMDEARTAESVARLLALRVAEPDAASEDVDRLEVAARDTHRLALAVRDSEESLDRSADREVARIESTAATLLDAVRATRSGQPTAVARALERLAPEQAGNAGLAASEGAVR